MWLAFRALFLYEMNVEICINQSWIDLYFALSGRMFSLKASWNARTLEMSTYEILKEKMPKWETVSILYSS